MTRWLSLGDEADFAAAALAFLCRAAGVPLAHDLAHPPLGAPPRRDAPGAPLLSTRADALPAALLVTVGADPDEVAARRDAATRVVAPASLALPGAIPYGLLEEGALWAAVPAPGAVFEVYGGGTFLGRVGAPLPGPRYAATLVGAIAFAAEIAGVPVRDALELASRFPGAEGLLEPVARVGALVFREGPGAERMGGTVFELPDDARDLAAHLEGPDLPATVASADAEALDGSIAAAALRHAERAR